MTTTTAPLRAYHGGSALKEAVLAELAEHRAADEIIRGTYWDGHRGCAVGCLTHDENGGHGQFPTRWGVPIVIARLIDSIFEGLPVDVALDWPARIMGALPVGADLTMVWPHFAVWLLVDPDHGVVRHARTTKAADSIRAVAALYQRRCDGDEPTEKEWRASAAAAAAAAAVDADAASAAAAARKARRRQADKLVELCEAAT